MRRKKIFPLFFFWLVCRVEALARAKALAMGAGSDGVSVVTLNDEKKEIVNVAL